MIAFVLGATLAPGSALAAFPGDNGRIAYVRFGVDFDILTILPDGSARRTLIEAGSNVAPSWSADGRRLVFIRRDGSGEAIHTMNADGGELTRVVAAVGSNVSPSFSPDGRRILYEDRRGSIRTIGVDGTNPRRVTSPRGSRIDADYTRYSPNGRRIVFAGAPPGNRPEGIWTMRANGSRFRRLTSNSVDTMPDYSPDGRHIVFMRLADPRQVRVMRSDGSRNRTIIGGEQITVPVFSPAGDRIAFGRGLGPFTECSDIYTVSPQGIDRRRVTDNCVPPDRVGSVGSPTWQPLPPPPSSEFEIAKVRRNKRRGVAKLGLEVPGAGKVRVAGTKKVKPASRRMPVAGPVGLPVKPRGKAKWTLRKRGAATVRARVTYNPDGAEQSSRSKQIKLKKRARG